MAIFEYRYGIRPLDNLAQYIHDEAIRMIDLNAEFADIAEFQNYLDGLQAHLIKRKKYYQCYPVEFESWWDKNGFIMYSDKRAFLQIRQKTPPQ